jgi:hypothetical protein
MRTRRAPPNTGFGPRNLPRIGMSEGLSIQRGAIRYSAKPVATLKGAS